jgi:hypothetical protein
MTCSNCCYAFIADDLAVVASKIIFQQQRGFVKDMHIVDCIIISSDAINILHRETI